MNLDDLTYFQTLDASGLLAHLDAFPEQFAAAWELGCRLPLPAEFRTAPTVVLAGTGTGHTACALAHAVMEAAAPRPVLRLSSLELPALVGPETLVLAVWEADTGPALLPLVEDALRRSARVLLILPEGTPLPPAVETTAHLWRYPAAGPARMAVSWLWPLTLAALQAVLGLNDYSDSVAQAVAAAQTQRQRLTATSPVLRNPAKRLAGQFMNRIILLAAADHLIPVMDRWRIMLALTAKTAAHRLELPEGLHHLVAGTLLPEALIDKYMALFLRPARPSPAVQAARGLYLTSGYNTDEVAGSGPSLLADMVTVLQYGDYVAYYLAMAYGVDPTPAPAVDAVRGG